MTVLQFQIARPRSEIIDQMAADLAASNTYGSAYDAFCCLFDSGKYGGSVEIVRCLDDARQRAFQIVEASVAMAMAEED